MAAVARPQNNRKRMKYVRDIPLTNRQSLCRILDVPGPGQNWKQLGKNNVHFKRFLMEV